MFIVNSLIYPIHLGSKWQQDILLTGETSWLLDGFKEVPSFPNRKITRIVIKSYFNPDCVTFMNGSGVKTVAYTTELK